MHAFFPEGNIWGIMGHLLHMLNLISRAQLMPLRVGAVRATAVACMGAGAEGAGGNTHIYIC